MAEKLPLTNDYVFKRVFAYEGNENVLKDFLEAILNIKINKIQIKNPDTKEKLDQWLWLISGKEEKIEMAEKENEEVKKAVRTLEQISADLKEREMYDSIIQEEFLESIARQKMLDMGRN